MTEKENHQDQISSDESLMSVHGLIVDLIKYNQKQQKIQWMFTGAILAVCVILAIIVVSSIRGYQEDFLDWISEMEWQTEITRTYEQDAYGEDSDIINDGQYNYSDYATHNQGGETNASSPEDNYNQESDTQAEIN